MSFLEAFDLSVLKSSPHTNGMDTVYVFWGMFRTSRRVINGGYFGILLPECFNARIS